MLHCYLHTTIYSAVAKSPYFAGAGCQVASGDLTGAAGGELLAAAPLVPAPTVLEAVFSDGLVEAVCVSGLLSGASGWPSAPLRATVAVVSASLIFSLLLEAVLPRSCENLQESPNRHVPLDWNE